MKSEEQIKQAMDFHGHDDLEQAAAVYREILAEKPEDPDASHLLGVVCYQQGEYKTARDLICKALSVRENHPQSHNNLGMVFKELGKSNDALNAFRRAVELQPDYAEAHNNLGTVLKIVGCPEEAEAAYNQAIALQPEYVNALNNLGNLYVDRKDYDKALGLYGQALAVNPDYPLSHFNLACALIPLGRLDEAEAALLKVVQEDSSHVAALNTLGRMYCLRYQIDKSVAAFQKSIETKPDSEEGYIGLGNTYLSINRLSKAALYFEKAIAIDKDSVEALNCLGLLNLLIGNSEQAMQNLAKAHTLEPGNMAVLCNLAALNMAQGSFAQSASLCREALKLQPDSAKAYYQLALVTHGKEDGSLVENITALLGSTQLTQLDKASLQFALAKLLEEQGKYSQSFACLVKANRIKRESFTFSLDWYQATVNRICEVYDAESFRRFSGKGYKGIVPIFIVGMPRSGSTLIEQILSSHPDVHGGGELSIFIDTVTDYLRLAADSEVIPADIGLKGKDLFELGKRYSQDLQLLAPEAKRITNKMLGNFFHIGIIRLILPNAKIIHCRRNPIDTCYSIYKKYFTRGHQYAYDLEDIGNYFLLYDQMMQHWKKVLPDGFIDIHCEDLIHDQEAETRRLLQYCDLDWYDGCMRFCENKRPVFTASSVQVRKSLTDESVEIWKKYEIELQVLLNILAPCMKGSITQD